MLQQSPDVSLRRPLEPSLNWINLWEIAGSKAESQSVSQSVSETNRRSLCAAEPRTNGQKCYALQRDDER